MFSTALALTGVLVTYARGVEIGRERFSDDGVALRSEISLAGQKATITIDRKSRELTLEAAGKTIRHPVPPGVLALANGHWQAYSLVAEQYPNAHEPTAVKVLVPGAGAPLDGKLTVTALPDKRRHIELTIGGLTVDVELAPNGAVTRASVPLQSVEVRTEGAPSPTKPATRKPPEGVAEEPLDVERPKGKLRGVLWRPLQAAKPPLVVFVAGSGPTDRDGNATVGLNTDCYRLLAEALAKAGVASLRFDKRGVGASDPFDEPSLTLDEYAGDVAAWLKWARSGDRFGKVTILGHSQGGLIALVLAQTQPPDALLLVATPGRPLWQVLHEQLARQIQGEQLKQLDDLIAALRDGKPVTAWPPEHAALFRPSIEKLWRSELALDPAKLVARLKLPITVVQGETDMQVGVDDAKRLAGARKQTQLVLLPRVNHVLKEEAARALPQASYGDPAHPLGPGVVDAVLKGVAR
jgi:pimeloyl-ACP methyl ester carboxylesterase